MTKTLLEALKERTIDFVHLNRRAPQIILTRKRDAGGRQTLQLLDVGNDFIEVGIEGRPNSAIVPRDQIVEVVWLEERK